MIIATLSFIWWIFVRAFYTGKWLRLNLIFSKMKSFMKKFYSIFSTCARFIFPNEYELFDFSQIYIFYL